MSNNANPAHPKDATFTLKPMSIWKSALYFILPALLFRLSLYNGIKILIDWGMQPFDASVVCFTLPAAILFALAFGFYKWDGHPLTWQDIKIRFRLLPMTTKDWQWALGGFVITFLTIGALAGTAELLIKTFPFGY